MPENRIIKVKYSPDGYTKTRAAYQYDYGQVLRLEGFPEGMLPDPFEVHFSVGSGLAKTQIGTDSAVSVLDECLERYGTIAAWLFLHDTASDGETKYTIEIPVRSRSKTVDASPTPVQQSAITQAIAALQTGVSAAETAQGKAEAAQAAAEAAAESVGEAAEQAQGKAGEAAASATAAAGSAEAAAGSATSAAGAATSAGESASAAAGSATAASGSAEAAAGSATAAAGSAAAAAQTVAGIEEAGAAQVLAVNTAGAAKVDAINTAGTEKVNAINTAGTEKVNAINTAGTEKVNAVNTAGAAQVQAVEAKGEEVIEEIPADYSALSADVTNLKSAINFLEQTLPTEETGQDLLNEETKNAGLTETALAVIGLLFGMMPQDESAVDIYHSLVLENERLLAIYEIWNAERSA